MRRQAITSQNQHKGQTIETNLQISELLEVDQNWYAYGVQRVKSKL
jgi:serine protease inhibitor ecotin